MFKMNTMGDYHDLYLKTDILLLADVFETFVGRCLYYYGLDLCHYFSSPQSSWDGMFKMIEVELERIFQTLTCIYFLKKKMRGGIFYTTIRFSKTNSK